MAALPPAILTGPGGQRKPLAGPRQKAPPERGFPRRPRVRPLITQNSGPTGSPTQSESHGGSSSQPHVSMVGFSQRQRFLDAQAGPPEDDDQPAQAPRMRVV